MILEGVVLERGREERRGEDATEDRTGETTGLNGEQRERLYFQREHMGDENTSRRMMTTMMTITASIIDIIRPASSSCRAFAVLWQDAALSLTWEDPLKKTVAVNWS